MIIGHYRPRLRALVPTRWPDATGRRWTRTIAAVVIALAALASSPVARSQDILDPSFVPPPWDVEGSTRVNVVALQPDGRMWVGGYFPSIGTTQPKLLRLNADGSLDATFSPPSIDYDVTAIVVQTDDSVLLAGPFNQIDGQPVPGLARLDASGTLDTSFQPAIPPNFNAIPTIGIQSDGKILVAGNNIVGDFCGASGSTVIVRLNPDGSRDETFASGSVTYGSLQSISVGPDGKILIGADLILSDKDCVTFTSHAALFLLNADGSVDRQMRTVSRMGFVLGMAALPDGRTLVSGRKLDGNAAVIRLNADYSLDATFSVRTDNYVSSILTQPNGRIVTAGSFTTLAGQPRNYVARLNRDGSPDPTFDPAGTGGPSGANGAALYALAAQANGRFLIAGAFVAIGLNETPRFGLARLLVPEVATSTLQYDADKAQLRWKRTGSSAEFQRVTFQASADGADWSSLGEGNWNNGVWTLQDAALPVGSRVLRGRGLTLSGGGQSGTSGSVLESTLQLVADVTPIANGGGTIDPATPQDVAVGDTMTFTLSPAAGMQILGVGGTCAGALIGAVFTTAPITADCTVEATFTADTDLIVTPMTNGGGTLSPASPQVVSAGNSVDFVVTADAHHSLVSVDGCGGALNGATFTTAPVAASCTINATFALDPVSVTPTAGAGGSISPSGVQTIGYGAAIDFALLPEPYHQALVAGSCVGTLSLDGLAYTTDPVTSDCTVEVSFPSVYFTVTPIPAFYGQISPSTPQSIAGGTSVVLTVTPNAGYTANIGGTCGGSLVGTTYTSAPIVGDCTVEADFEVTSYTVTPSAGPHGAISPNLPQAAMFGGIVSFTLTPEDGYATSVGGSCGGTLSGNVFVTRPVASDCTVEASFLPVPDSPIFANGFDGAAP